MKKILLILAVTGVLISCSNKEDSVKKDGNTELTVQVNKVDNGEVTESVEGTGEVKVEIEKPALEEDDYSAVSEPSKKETKPAKRPTKSVEKADSKGETPKMETSIEEKVDADVDKEITKIEDEAKTVKTEVEKADEGSNKTLYGILGVIVAAVAAFFIFKKK